MVVWKAVQTLNRSTWQWQCSSFCLMSATREEKESLLLKEPTSSKHFTTMAIQERVMIIQPNFQVLSLARFRHHTMLPAILLHNFIPYPPCGCGLPQRHTHHHSPRGQQHSSQSLAAPPSAVHHDWHKSQTKQRWAFPLTGYMPTTPVLVLSMEE